MAQHIDTGRNGESLAATYLLAKGFTILEKNWRHKRSEVDVIAEQNGVLHFIEIKTRRSKKFGLPEEKVGTKKMQQLMIAAEEYLYLNPQWQRIQFDILAILCLPDLPVDYFFIEDVS